MRRQNLLAFLLVLVSSLMVAPTHAQTMSGHYCPGSTATDKERSMHVDLLEYAVFAETAYNELGQTTINLHSTCPMGISEQTQDTVIDVRSIPANVISRAVDRIRETNSNWTFNEYTDKAGEKFFSCTVDQTTRERLVVALRYVLSNNDLSFSIKAAIVGASVMTATQEIGLVELESANGEKLVGIQGTELFSIDQWNTSIQNLIKSQDSGNSCIFRFAVEVATYFFGNEVAGEISEYRNKNSYSIVGHSLGGAVAQHIAKKTDLEQIIKNHHKDATFKAFSFNSIGVVPDPETISHRRNIVSVRVAGEVLEQLQRTVGRSQIGHIYRYGILSVQQEGGNGIRLHRMKAVKNKICKCLTDSRDMFEYGYR